MELTRVQQAIKILNASAEASSADLETVTKPQPKKNAKSKPQPKKREARK
jgi:hypothetical protein